MYQLDSARHFGSARRVVRELGVAAALVTVCACAVDSAGDGGETMGEAGEAGEVGPTDDTGPMSCGTNSDCGAGEVCLSAGTCASAYNRTYEVFVNSASVAGDKQNGDNWDPLGDSPDPFFTVTVDGEEVFESSEFDNSLGASWTQGIDVYVTDTTTIEISLWDRDLNDHDLIESMQWGPVPVSLLISGDFNSDGGQATWGATFELQD